MNTGQAMRESIIQPLPVDFEAYDYHVILYLKGHKAYEAIEAMIRENPSGMPYIRAITTLHGGLQVNHINDEAFAEELKHAKKYSKVYFSHIKYERIYKKKCIETNLSFTSYRNEDIILHFVTSGRVKASGTGLINPGRRSHRLSLPVIYPELTANAGKGSFITINGQFCDIPVISGKLPAAFGRLKGYYSERFYIAGIRAGTRNMAVTAHPAAAMPGEEWVFELKHRHEAYRILSAEGNKIRIQGDSCSISAELSDDNVLIEHITFLAAKLLKDTQPELTIAFTPPVPVSTVISDSMSHNYDFSISINDHNNLLTGKVQTSMSKGVLTIDLLPRKPEWAAERQVHIFIKEQGAARFCIKTKISPVWFAVF